MSPRDFLKKYHFDHRMIDGSFYPRTPLRIGPGDRVGVVLFNLGGPTSLEGVESFLYNLFMDPAIIDIPLPAMLRAPLCQYIARKRAESVREEYALIGGASPLNEHTRRQAALLEARLEDELSAATGATFRTYMAMRYAPPMSEDTVQRMRQDGITHVVLLPLYPQYSKTTTGASVVYWYALQQEGLIPDWPTSLVFEYATHPDLISAFSERITEGLSRFADKERDNVHILFSAHGTPLYEKTRRHDPYQELVFATVQAIMDARGGPNPHSTAFQSKVGPAKWLRPSTPDELEALAGAGQTRVLIVPVAFVSDHVETLFELDMEVRKEAIDAGITRFEVCKGLNDNVHFVGCLVDQVRQHVMSRDGAAPESAPLHPA